MIVNFEKLKNMKRKFLILSLIIAGASTFASAQNTKKYVSEKWNDNIFIGVGGGIQGCVNPNNFDYGFGHAITPVINISAGKYINPVWGGRMQLAGAWSTLYSKYGVPAGEYNKIKNKQYVTLHADAIYNMSNSFFGYNPDRLFTLSAFMGPGLTFAKAYRDQSKVNALVNGSVGLMGLFNISRYFDISLEARGEISPSMFGKDSKYYSDGAVSVMAGLTYTFGGKKFLALSNNDAELEDLNNKVNKYRNSLNDAEDELKSAKLKLQRMKNAKPAKTKVKEVVVAGPRAIFFQIGKSKIDAYGEVNIKLAAKVMKENTGKVYKIRGYADKATGSAAWNKKLSDARAKAVYDALLKEGVSKDQMEIVAEGGTANMFGKDYLNRVTILE